MLGFKSKVDMAECFRQNALNRFHSEMVPYSSLGPIFKIIMFIELFP